MRIVGFYHSLISDWNHGNAHFLRGLVSELQARGHEVIIYEPEQGWSLTNLLEDAGAAVVDQFRQAYPGLVSRSYGLATLSLDRALEGAELVLVHEWNAPELVRRIGVHHRAHRGYALLFHDTHHRLVTAPHEMEQFDLSGYDGVLAFGEVLRALYLERGLTERAWTFHEAADTRVFRPREATVEGDLVWVGNWGDGERGEELQEFLLEPVHTLGLRASIYGVRYPQAAREQLRAAGVAYHGFLPNFQAPEVFARHALTVHVPRRPYVRALVGVPTIRVFEALACGIPLVSAPWSDVEGLFRGGQDFLIARDGDEMKRHLRAVLHEPALASSLREHGLETIRSHHSCGHRAEQLLSIARSLGVRAAPPELREEVLG
jgi:spore maturation protein CgeB